MVKKTIKKGIEVIATRHELFLGVGVAMMALTLLKLFKVVDIDSDWYWFIAGCGLALEGLIMTAKQRKFDKKYKVVLREE